MMECKSNESGVLKELSGRKRKKLYNKLKTQMEFYFSDSNLAKDKFLYDLIKKSSDGYVELQIFKSFNKIKAVTEDLNIIVTSLIRSEILEVSDDKTKVRRKTEIEISKDFDACTLYVEGLPSYADQKWIRDVFDHFGTVEYINIPRFNISQKIKGFAFIEFSSPESVLKACQFYKNSLNGDSEIWWDEYIRKGAKRKVEDTENKTTKKTKIVESSEQKVSEDSKTDVEKSKSSDLKEKLTKKKRKLEINNSDDDEYGKKPKLSAEQSNFKDLQTEQLLKLPDNGDLEVTKAESDNSKMMETLKTSPSKEIRSDLMSANEVKKKRKHSKKGHNKHERPVLRVMSKSEWKNYRNKYLDLQRLTMNVLKKNILLESNIMRQQESDNKLEIPSKKELAFQNDVILKIKLPKQIENPTDIKEQIKAYTVVAYIDAPQGSDEVFVRCHAAEDASLILQDKKLNPIGDVILLTGKEESDYWLKIKSDREAKFNDPVKRKRRGRDRLMAKAAKLLEQKNKHIYFDE